MNDSSSFFIYKIFLSLNISQDEDKLRINIMTVAFTELPEMLSMPLCCVFRLQFPRVHLLTYQSQKLILSQHPYSLFQHLKLFPISFRKQWLSFLFFNSKLNFHFLNLHSLLFWCLDFYIFIIGTEFKTSYFHNKSIPEWTNKYLMLFVYDLNFQSKDKSVSSTIKSPFQGWV